MEFPDLGKHCSEKTCNQLDFLPLKCDACKQDFCKDHFTYTAHKCAYAFKKDVQVPVCPLCNNPIPIKKGEIPDVVVGEHIDRDCKSHPGRREKVFRCGSLWVQAVGRFTRPVFQLARPAIQVESKEMTRLFKLARWLIFVSGFNFVDDSAAVALSHFSRQIVCNFMKLFQ
nr:AN1-type zinc finger protein 2A isoform X2 [Equus asinus]